MKDSAIIKRVKLVAALNPIRVKCLNNLVQKWYAFIEKGALDFFNDKEGTFCIERFY